MPVLDALRAEWEKTERNIALVLAQQKNLIGLGTAVRRINENNPFAARLRPSSCRRSRLQPTRPRARYQRSGNLVMLTQRWPRTQTRMLGGDVIDPEVAFLLGKDTNTFRDLLQGLTKGQRRAAHRGGEGRRDRGDARRAGQVLPEFKAAVSAILGNLQGLVNAKTAARQIVDDSETLLAATEKLTDAYTGELGAQHRRLGARAGHIARNRCYLPDGQGVHVTMRAGAPCRPSASAKTSSSRIARTRMRFCVS